MKSVKNLLIPFIILIALVIGVVIYYVVDNMRTIESSETAAGSIDVVYFNMSDISMVTVYNRDTAHNTVVKCLVSTDGSVKYEYAGDDIKQGEKFSQNALSNYAYAMSTYSSNAKVSTLGNFAEYGLDNPKITVTIDAVNGSTTTVYLGNTSPNGQYCYMYVAGSADIYAVPVNKLETADKRAIDFLESTMLDIDYKDLKNVHFDRKTDNLSLDATVTINNSGSAYFTVYKPYNQLASNYFTNMIHDITQLQITQYLDLTAAELSSYGLDNPYYHLVLTLNSGENIELFFSQKNNGYYYGRMNGMDNYFMLSEKQISGLELQELVLINPYVTKFTASSYSSITVTYGDKSFKLDLEVAEGKPITDPDANVSLDGRNAQIKDSKGRSYSSILFESLTGIKIGGVELKDGINTSAGAEITFSLIDKSYNTTTFEFYTRDTDSYYVCKNGEYTGFYVYSKEFFYDAGSDTYNYGCWSAYELLNEAITNNINGIYDIPVATE
jgi:hypothetical protein